MFWGICGTCFYAKWRERNLDMSHCRKKQTTEYFAFTARARGRGQAGVKYIQSRLGSSGTVDNINSQTATAFHIIGIKVGQRRPALFHPDTRTRSILIQTTTFPYCCVPTVHCPHWPPSLLLSVPSILSTRPARVCLESRQQYDGKWTLTTQK